MRRLFDQRPSTSLGRIVSEASNTGVPVIACLDLGDFGRIPPSPGVVLIGKNTSAKSAVPICEEVGQQGKSRQI
jgi:hypothetical protein